MPQSRVNDDGSMTYWPDGWDEPEAVKGKVSVDKGAPEAQSKVVEPDEPKKASGRTRASSK